MQEKHGYNVKITDPEGSFTVGYWFTTKSNAVQEAKRQYPGHKSYKAERAEGIL